MLRRNRTKRPPAIWQIIPLGCCARNLPGCANATISMGSVSTTLAELTGGIDFALAQPRFHISAAYSIRPIPVTIIPPMNMIPLIA